MATSNTRYRPDWSSGGITAPNLDEVLLGFSERMAKQQDAGLDRALKQQQLTEEQRRWDIANSRAQRKEDREIAEQSASDAYYKEILKGPQAVGGILNRESVINQASQFDFTPEEIAFSNTNKISTPEQARKLGNEALAKKMEGQLALSKSVDTMYNQGVLDETRPEMYERALGAVTSKGLPASKELVASLDAARLAEQTATDAKLKENREAEAKLLKDQRDDLWKVVNARTGGNTFTDADGNTVTLPALQREIKAGNKADVSGVNTVQEAINKLGFDKPEKKEAAIKQSNEYVKLLEARGIPTDAAADIVASELSKKESNPWLSYVGFSSMDPKFDTKSINTYADMIAERYNKTIRYPSKFELASRLADSNAVSASKELARLRAEREALLGTPEERRGSKIDEFIRPKEIEAAAETTGPTGKPLKARINKNIKSITGIPDSMVASEGVTNESYKDGNGYSIAMGYNLYYNKGDIDKDFEDANISPEKAFIAKTRPQDLVLDDGEAQRLSQVAYYKYADSLDKQLGGTLDNLSPQMQATALQMHYRGDLFNKADYAKELRKYVKADDYDGLVKYVSENAATLPAPVVRRLENDLGAPVKNAIRGTMSDNDKIAYLDKALSSKVKTSEEKGLSSKVDTNSVTTSKDGDTSSEVRALLEALNKSGQGTTDEAAKLNSRYAELLKKEKAENKAKKWDTLTDANLFELLGIVPERKRVQAQESLTPEPDASLEEPGLEHDFTWVPGLGLLNKTRNKTSMYDDIYKGVFKSDKGRLLDDVLTKDPLSVQEDILRQTFGNKTVDVIDDIFKRYTSMSRADLIAEASRLRNIEKPSTIDLAALEKLQQLLRNSR